MWNFGRFLNARSTKIHSTVGCKNVLRVKIKVIQSKASKHFIAVDSSILHNSVGGFICTFSRLISLSFTFQSSKLGNHFTMSSKYFDMVYIKRDSSSCPISFEVKWNDSTAIPYRASTGPEQSFPCVLFPHKENPVFITGTSLQCVTHEITKEF